MEQRVVKEVVDCGATGGRVAIFLISGYGIFSEECRSIFPENGEKHSGYCSGVEIFSQSGLLFSCRGHKIFFSFQPAFRLPFIKLEQSVFPEID